MLLEVNKTITDDCIITHIDENNVQDDRLIAVILYVKFLDKYECDVYVAIDSITEDDSEYAMIESDSIIHNSFKELLDTDKAWSIVKESIRVFIQHWNENQEYYEVE